TCHPSAEWVYSQVKRELPNISLGTVYRNLRRLTEAGEIASYESTGGVSRFDGCAATHYHFRCERCGAMIDIDEPVNTDLDRRVAAHTGLDIRCHVLEFRGLCRDCQLKGEADPLASGAHGAVSVKEVRSDGGIHSR
ncbi:MAG: transcriptional repressor, partial [Dehalococcoidia bacterium]|nr:transcriptional repressor [Dehalococcoidia bacterium]